MPPTWPVDAEKSTRREPVMTDEAGRRPVITVVSYNVYGVRYREGLRHVVTTLAPDVIVVNETPKVPLVWRSQCNRLARSWGMRRVAGGRDAGSNMICVSERVQVEMVSARRLRQPRFKPRRGVVTAQLAVDGVEFGVVGVHLSLMRDSRPVEAAAAIADSAGLRGPLLMCGDLNEGPQNPCWQLFRGVGLVDHADSQAFTSTAAQPVNRIDALLVRGAEVIEHVVPDVPGQDMGAASDHLPVLARIRIGQPAPA